MKKSLASVKMMSMGRRAIRVAVPAAFAACLVLGCNDKKDNRVKAPGGEEAPVAKASNPAVPAQSQTQVPVAERRDTSPPPEPKTPIQNTIRKGTPQQMQSLLDGGLSPDAMDEGGDTLLVRSLAYGKADLARLLISKGASVNARNESGYTPLHAAADKCPELVAELIARGADVNAAAKDGFTPLHSASFAGHHEIAKQLLSHGSRVDAKDDNGHTPLYFASERGHVQVVELLLNHGAAVNAKDKYGRTPMFQAADKGHDKVVAVLKAHGGKE